MAILNLKIKISFGQIMLTKIPSQRLRVRVYFSVSKLKFQFLLSPVRQKRPVVRVVFSHYLSYTPNAQCATHVFEGERTFDVRRRNRTTI